MLNRKLLLRFVDKMIKQLYVYCGIHYYFINEDEDVYATKEKGKRKESEDTVKRKLTRIEESDRFENRVLTRKDIKYYWCEILIYNYY